MRRHTAERRAHNVGAGGSSTGAGVVFSQLVGEGQHGSARGLARLLKTRGFPDSGGAQDERGSHGGIVAALGNRRRRCCSRKAMSGRQIDAGAKQQKVVAHRPPTPRRTARPAAACCWTTDSR